MPLHRRTAFALAAATLGTAALPALGQRRLRIAFANYNDESSFGTQVLSGLRRVAADRPDIELTFFDNKQDAANTVENARTIAVLKPDVLMEYSVIAQANAQVARVIKEALIPILSIQVRVPGTPLYAVDNSKSGYESAKGLALAAKARFSGEVPACLLLGLPEMGPLMTERAGAARRAMLEVFPSTAIAEASTKNEPAVARQVTTDFMTKNPGRRIIIWAHEDAMGIAALTAARNAAREADILIASTGGEAVVFPEIRRPGSSYIGTFSFFPEFWGADLIPLAARLAAGETIADSTTPAKQLLIQAANIDQLFPRG
jgi:ABC-type sugar transport system substrate-binding protein